MRVKNSLIFVLTFGCGIITFGADNTPFFRTDVTKGIGKLELFSKNYSDYEVKSLKTLNIDGVPCAEAAVNIPSSAKGSYFYLQIKLPHPLPIRNNMIVKLQIKNIENGGCVGVIAQSGKKQIWCYYPRIGDIGKNKWRTISINVYESLVKSAKKIGADIQDAKLSTVWFRFVGKRHIKFLLRYLEVDYLHDQKLFCQPNKAIAEQISKELPATKSEKLKQELSGLRKQIDDSSDMNLAQIVELRLKLAALLDRCRKSKIDESMESLFK